MMHVQREQQQTRDSTDLELEVRDHNGEQLGRLLLSTSALAAALKTPVASAATQARAPLAEVAEFRLQELHDNLEELLSRLVEFGQGSAIQDSPTMAIGEELMGLFGGDVSAICSFLQEHACLQSQIDSWELLLKTAKVWLARRAARLHADSVPSPQVADGITANSQRGESR